MIELATCSYSEYRTTMGLAVRTSVGSPKWFTHTMAVWESLAPQPWTLRMPIEPYRERYLNKLNTIGVDQLKDEALRISVAAGQDRLVLLCFEALYKPDAWCHRSMFGKWWEEQTGQKVEELGRVDSQDVLW